MSQMVRRQLIEISNTLRDANNLLEKLFQGVADEEMIGLLTECQNCAITMGNKIEAVYGSGLKSIHALENYCESIYQISQHLDSLPECMEIYEYTKEQLLEVQSGIEEIPDKKEIAFMPYKASMWDSLESVYLAAREDENCEVYVVPIPYFDRKADKTLGEMHYEGEEYPANISITNWEKYNFEERLPDVIYIHNAYDDSNLVTCVHPRFFSGNLKKYTEKLVYIPYFVLEEIDPNDQVKINAMKHFCFLPGIVNADRVILQSENMRQIYMNEYAKVVEAAGGTIDRKQLEEKFLGTGSPKFDKIMNTKKEDLDIPEEWLYIIKKPDGSWKKIIFYNTSVTALLQYNEKMLDKMRYVFNVFKQHQNEVALLWRPHPLIKTTIESMRPQLWAEYSKIVDQYKEEGWGIYDDSSDVDRVVILCDAYYGDQSSVVQLVEKAEKPALLQDIIDYHNTLLASDGACLVGDEVWFVETETNSLCTLTIKDAVIHMERPFDKSFIRRSIYRLIAGQGEIYGFPGWGNKICKYDMAEQTIDFFQEKTKKKIWCEYYALERYENYIFFFPMLGFKIMKIDLNDLSHVEFICLPILEIGKKGYFTKRFIRKGDYLIIPCACTNKVLFFNLKNDRYEWKKLNFGENGFADIESYKNKIYLLTQDGKVIETSYDFRMQREIVLDEEYGFLVACYDKLILIPKHDNKFLKVGIQNLELSPVEYPVENIFNNDYVQSGMITFSDIAYDEKRAILLPRCSNMIVIIDKLNGTLDFHDWTFARQSIVKWQYKQKGLGTAVKEPLIKLEDFISI